MFDIDDRINRDNRIKIDDDRISVDDKITNGQVR